MAAWFYFSGVLHSPHGVRSSLSLFVLTPSPLPGTSGRVVKWYGPRQRHQKHRVKMGWVPTPYGVWTASPSGVWSRVPIEIRCVFNLKIWLARVIVNCLKLGWKVVRHYTLWPQKSKPLSNSCETMSLHRVYYFPFWLSLCRTEMHNLLSRTNFSGLQTSTLNVVFAQRHHHHWSFVVHGCRQSATELFRSPLPVSGTNYHATSHLHRPHYTSFLQSSDRLTFLSCFLNDFP